MHHGTVRWGAIGKSHAIPLDCHWPSLSEGLAQDAVALERAVAAAQVHLAPTDCVWLKPADPGSRIFCIGLNYGRHVEESGRKPPEYPSVFLRTQESFADPSSDIVRPGTSDRYDFEAELAVVIGRAGRRIRLDEAGAHVAGYTCLGEHSVRDFQKHSTQVTAGKNFDDSGAIGPWIVSADEVADPNKLEVLGILNGVTVQHGCVADLIFPIPVLISYISQFTALRPGDIIATGTPEGVGVSRSPQLFMQPGDVFEVLIPGVGHLRNSVVMELDVETGPAARGDDHRASAKSGETGDD
jgi:2-keto-4-pentenoate hydratase/2-oxohepta-3-ene-1,7-dioic acid hydratase in catechol pathway